MPPSHSPLKGGEERQHSTIVVTAVQRLKHELAVTIFSPLQGGVRGGPAAVLPKIQRATPQPAFPQ
jgi:hypothetical protein